MQLVIILLCATAAVAEFYGFGYRQDTFYVQDPAEVKKRVNCLLDKDYCPDEFLKDKARIYEGLRGSCANCPPHHKYLIRTFLDNVRRRFPSDYVELQQKYDPNHEYSNSLRRAIGLRRPYLLS